MSNSGASPSSDLAGQSGFGVASGEPRCLADILMGKLASLIWPADVVCHRVSITCHSALMPLDRSDQTTSFDLGSLLKWRTERQREGSREREKKGGKTRRGKARTLKAVNKMTLLFPLSYHVEKPIMVMHSMSVGMQQSLSLSVSLVPPPPFFLHAGWSSEMLFDPVCSWPAVILYVCCRNAYSLRKV